MNGNILELEKEEKLLYFDSDDIVGGCSVDLLFFVKGNFKVTDSIFMEISWKIKSIRFTNLRCWFAFRLLHSRLMLSNYPFCTDFMKGFDTVISNIMIFPWD